MKWFPFIAIVGGAALFGGAIALKEESKPLQETQALIMPSPTTVRLTSIGQHRLATAALWTRSIAYFGDSYLHGQKAVYLGGLMDAATSLDPSFKAAYRFTGAILDDDDSLTIKVLRRGTSTYPTDWRLATTLALKLANSGKYEDAAKAMDPFASTDTIPDHIRSLGSTFRRQGMPLDIAMMEYLDAYFSQTPLLRKTTLHKMAIRLFHPKAPVGTKSTDEEKQRIEALLTAIEKGQVSPQTGFASLLSMAKTPPQAPAN